jgi:hypothetical protein
MHSQTSEEIKIQHMSILNFCSISLQKFNLRGTYRCTNIALIILLACEKYKPAYILHTCVIDPCVSCACTLRAYTHMCGFRIYMCTEYMCILHMHVFAYISHEHTPWISYGHVCCIPFDIFYVFAACLRPCFGLSVF